VSGLAQLRAAVRLIRRGYAARGTAPAPAASGPRRRQAVERTGIRPEPAELRRYLAATAGDSLLPAAERGILPPLFSCTWETLLALELLSTLEPPLPLGAMVHAETDLLRVRPAATGEGLRCRLELERAEAVPSGVRLEVIARNWEPGGQLRTEARHRFRVRTGGGGERRDAEPLDLDGWERLAEWSLPASAGRRYARASGDWNPIHLFAWTARPLGFRRPILHGFCIAAMVAHAAGEHLWPGDPAALRRFRIAFRSPLALPGRASLWLRGHDAAHAFRVTDAEGVRLFAEGEIGGGGAGNPGETGS
jgi:acyl dehydratase